MEEDAIRLATARMTERVRQEERARALEAEVRDTTPRLSTSVPSNARGLSTRETSTRAN